MADKVERKQTLEELGEYNRRLTNKAVDACRAINPSNPMAVARKLLEMFEQFRSLVTVCEYLVAEHPQTIGAVFPQAKEVLAAITKPAKSRE